jgi:hypothetical protein
MNIIELKTKPKEEVLEFIGQRLSFENEVATHLRHIDKDAFKKEHRRFEMSGYESKVGQCTIFNQTVLNEFADLGIYDYTNYLFLDFYKGHGNLYLQYFNNKENLEFELGGHGTTEIIYFVFTKTIFSDNPQRRRN